MQASRAGRWSIPLDHGPDAPRTARRALENWLADVPEPVRANALVVVSELVANAVRHGRPPIHVAATLEDGVLAVEVSDAGGGRPRRQVPTERGGRGLNLVHLLAERVAIDSERACVRCEFAHRATTLGATEGRRDGGI